MRYAIFTDIHANLEALEAVLAKIDELAQQQPIDQLWFLGDLVGYGPNPNECIDVLLKRTDVIIAGNHDWAAVGKIDLEDFSPAARISAEWTAKQLTEEHRDFLIHLPERIQIGECTLVHGSPYGPLWEYLTSEVLAERSFQYYNTRYCFVGHTHVPVIYQQPDTLANAPTIPLDSMNTAPFANNDLDEEEEIETKKMVAVRPQAHMNSVQGASDSAVTETVPEIDIAAHTTHDDTEGIPGINDTDTIDEDDDTPTVDSDNDHEDTIDDGIETIPEIDAAEQPTEGDEERNERVADLVLSEEVATSGEEHEAESKTETTATNDIEHDEQPVVETEKVTEVIIPKETHSTHSTEGVTEDRFNSEIEELLTLLGLSQSMVQVTNEMIVPPEGKWRTPEGYRAIVNPGGVGQPRDGDPRAAFMIYDTEQGFTFYRIHYNIKKTQEKIIQAGLPQYLAVRLSYGR